MINAYIHVQYTYKRITVNITPYLDDMEMVDSELAAPSGRQRFANQAAAPWLVG